MLVGHSFLSKIDPKRLALFFACISYPVGCSALVGFFIKENVKKWYKPLKKPWYAPPDYVFRPVWLSLYFLMGTSTFLIFSSPKALNHPLSNVGLSLFTAQFLCNLFWCPTFFIEHKIYISAWIANALQNLVGLTTIIFFQIQPISACCLLPYYAWTTLACKLTTDLALLNDEQVSLRSSTERIKEG